MSSSGYCQCHNTIKGYWTMDCHWNEIENNCYWKFPIFIQKRLLNSIPQSLRSLLVDETTVLKPIHLMRFAETLFIFSQMCFIVKRWCDKTEGWKMKNKNKKIKGKKRQRFLVVGYNLSVAKTLILTGVHAISRLVVIRYPIRLNGS